jgi:DNA-directed RNA polymerase alpha subunit
MMSRKQAEDILRAGQILMHKGVPLHRPEDLPVEDFGEATPAEDAQGVQAVESVRQDGATAVSEPDIRPEDAEKAPEEGVEEQTEEPQEYDEPTTGPTPLTALTAYGLPENAIEPLEGAGYDTVDSLVDVPEEDLLKIEGIGKSTAKKIRQACEKFTGESTE